MSLAYNFIDNVFPYTNPSSGNVGFTGPDGLRDYRAHLVTEEDRHEVGVGDHSSEHSGAVGYLFRPAPGTPLTRPRSAMPGEIGWAVPTLTDWTVPNTGRQIMLGQFRQAAEDRSTHEHMGCWYPAPYIYTSPGSDGYYHENIYSGRPNTANVPRSSPRTSPPRSSQGRSERPPETARSSRGGRVEETSDSASQ